LHFLLGKIEADLGGPFKIARGFQPQWRLALTRGRDPGSVVAWINRT
jgi:hypothetical protein